MRISSPVLLRFGAGITLILLPLVLGRTAAGRRLEEAARDASLPLLRSAGYLRTALAAAPDSNAERALRDQIDRLTVEVASLRTKERELAEVSALIGLPPPLASRIIPARVLGMAIDPERRVLFLDRGTDAGIEPGDAVITAGHWLLGIVTSAAPARAAARLLTDEGATVSARLSAAGAPLIVSGHFGTGAFLRLIPSTENIAAGATVVTAGIEQAIPPGIVIGRVHSEIPSEDEPFHTATLELSPDVGSLPQVVGVLRREVLTP